MNSYRELAVWQRAMEMVTRLYRCTEEFPKREVYGLSSQLQRAAVSVPPNIAEGHARDSTKDFLRHLSFARGLLAEVETLLLVASQLRYITSEVCEKLLAEIEQISRMLRGLQKSLRARLED